MKNLNNKRVLITGGAQGIGAATAERFLEEVAKVIIMDKDLESLKKIRHKLPQLIACIHADVSIREQVGEAFQQIDSLWGGLDVLINNAGISIRHRGIEIPHPEWH